MTEIMSNAGWLVGLAFVVNLIVQLTKGCIPLPTKLWCILVSLLVMVLTLFVVKSRYVITTSDICLSLVGSFIVAYVAMYGFDTLKDLWERFKKGENINE